MRHSPTWRKHLLLEPRDVPPSRADWEVIGVFNPGAAWWKGRMVLLVRVAERPRERRDGYVGLPRWDVEQGPVVDWLPAAEVETIDPRVVRLRSSGTVRLTFASHLKVVQCEHGVAVSRLGASLLPRELYEEYGIEDPRITRLGERYWITYVAVSSHGVATALASTEDFVAFERHGIIFPPENKDVVLFPERIGGKYYALHRPNGATPFTTPEMWIASSDDLLHWGNHRPLRIRRNAWGTGRVGAGCPPLRLADSWFLLYHGNERPTAPGDVGRYVASAAWLDISDPAHVVGVDPQPWLEPTEEFERTGFVPDVVFPTGLIEADNQLFVYYGAADCRTAVAVIERGSVPGHSVTEGTSYLRS